MLDPFAGGGAIPLEAMRLGCEVTATDINPVAWFILKCTLEYPQRLAGQTRPLPEFAVKDRQFIESFLKAKGFKGANLRATLERLGHSNGARLEMLSQDDPVTEADLAWHVRAWGRWVFAGARKELALYYPTYAEFQPLAPDSDHDPRPIRLLDVDDNGVPQLDPLNAEFASAYLKERKKPALDRQANGGLSMGADGYMQTVPGDAPTAEDSLAMQEGQEARSSDNGA